MNTDTPCTPEQIAAIAAAAQMRAIDLRWLAGQVERLGFWHAPNSPGAKVIQRAANELRQLAGGKWE